jgi:predicted RNase H-like HicB family nuclease
VIGVTTTNFETATEARAKFKDVLDAAESGVTVTIRRDSARSSVVDTERLRHTLAMLVVPDAQVFSEGGEWGAFVPGVPSVSATGDTLDELLDDLVVAARDYAEAWNDHLRHAPNHVENWGFVQVVTLSDDDQLRAWLSA